jgi:general stress protein 26
MTAKSNNKSIQKLASLIKDIRFAMLTTVCPDGTLRCRPMATQHDEFDGVLWFFTHVDDAKVHEIEDDQRVNVSYADPDKNNYVSVSGRASLVREKVIAKELWNPLYKAWFPKGLDDPKLALLRVAVEQAEYWDSPNSKLVQLGGFLKAVVTGKPAKGGENEKVTLRRKKASGASARSAGGTSAKRLAAKATSRSRPSRPTRARAGRR